MNDFPQGFFDDTEVAFAYKSNDALKNANFVFSTAHYPLIVGIGKGLVNISLKLHLPVKFIIRDTVFRHFCGGEDIKECQETARQLARYGVGAILDYSVEGAHNEAGFDATVEETLRTIKIAKNEPESPFCVFKPTGIASSALLEKIQLGKELTKREEEKYENALKRFDTIANTAYEHGVRLLIDAEETWYQNPIDEIVYGLMEKYNRERAIVFNTYQMYRTASLSNIEDACDRAKEKGFILGVKLVRGAYMEKERERAQAKRYPDPIQPDKESTDRDYNSALKFCVDHAERTETFNGSHNEYSNWYLAHLLDQAGIAHNDPRFWFAQLYGMSDHISFALAKLGYNVAKYVPYGPVASVMPYLLRRADENTSIAGQTNKELKMIRKELKRRRSSRKSA